MARITEYYSPGSVVTFKLGEDIDTPGVVQISGDWTVSKVDAAGDEDRVIGVLLESGDSGDKRGVLLGKPLAKLVANGAITAGSDERVKADPTSPGRVIAIASPGTIADLVDVCGIPISSASAAGEFVWVALY